MDQLDGSAWQTSWTNKLDKQAGRTSWMDQLDGPAGRIGWTDQLDGPAGWTSWTDQLEEPAWRTSSLYLKPWPVCIFEDWPFSLYFVAASESDEGLVYIFLAFFDIDFFCIFSISDEKIRNVTSLTHFWKNSLILRKLYIPLWPQEVVHIPMNKLSPWNKIKMTIFSCKTIGISSLNLRS